ncbi:hypothetical protein HPB51_028714 [Rhipicephalus microplus]|uniref:Uncharacterized protein n=1 Tax=Rhipicephalus microplus TaxID=6941 RepID=A0A9J6CWQ5_RHIMP|nr:hypothetical protein HPB51_028714 [Rhipicephalus microplus]
MAVKFVSVETIKSSQIGDVVSRVLGFTVTPSDPWNSLAPVNPFKVPKATLVPDFDGFDGDTTLDDTGEVCRTGTGGPLYGAKKLYGAKMAYLELLLTVSPEVNSRLNGAVKDAELAKVLRDGPLIVSLPERTSLLLSTAKLMLEQLSQQANKRGAAPSMV